MAQLPDPVRHHLIVRAARRGMMWEAWLHQEALQNCNRKPGEPGGLQVLIGKPGGTRRPSRTARGGRASPEASDNRCCKWKPGRTRKPEQCKDKL